MGTNNRLFKTAHIPEMIYIVLMLIVLVIWFIYLIGHHNGFVSGVKAQKLGKKPILGGVL